MREIKFRAWDEKTKTMHNVIGFDKLDIYTDTWDGGSGREVLFRYRSEKVQYTPAILLQYTGLKDRQGVEIYEGDIVKYMRKSGWSESYSQTDVVEYINGEFLPRERFDECGDSFYSEKFTDFEVIGNIYEHSHLLDNK